MISYTLDRWIRKHNAPCRPLGAFLYGNVGGPFEPLATVLTRATLGLVLPITPYRNFEIREKLCRFCNKVLDLNVHYLARLRHKNKWRAWTVQ